MNREAIIRQTPLFQGVTDTEFNTIFESDIFQIASYEKGHIIDRQHVIGIVLSGKLQAVKDLMSGKQMYLKSFRVGSMFGIGSLFAEKLVHLSHMEVIRSSEVAFIDEKNLLTLFGFESILLNYLKFTNSRIRYLNQKIDIISQTTIYDRLKMYFNDQQIIQDSKDQIFLPISKSDLAEFIGVSRASLYRVLDEMVEAGEIMIHHNQIKFMR